MKEMLLPFWQLALFREKPQNMPYSRALFLSFAMLFVMLFFLQLKIVDSKHSISSAHFVYYIVSMLISYFLYTWIILFVFSYSKRIWVTLNCLFATHLLIQLIATPVLYLSSLLNAANFSAFFGVLIFVLLFLITLLIAIWQYLITAYIYRYALATSTLKSLWASVGLLAFNMIILSLWRVQ